MAKGFVRSNGSIDMLTGPLLKKLLLFSLPLMASSVLQLLFNAADVVVVGRYASYNSLAAVGGTTAIVNLVVNLLVGISIGVNVVIARYLGEGGRQKEISRALHTAVALALVGGVALGLLGIAVSEWMLHAVSTPEDTFDLALSYLRIYFLGTPAIMLYNYGAAALRARGDTRRPLIFLTVSGVVNVVLNLFFVIVLHLDVTGVALATVISEVLSAGLVLVCLMHAEDELHFSWHALCLDPKSLKIMAHVGIPAGFQSCLFSISNVVIQSAINTYGSVVMAGCSAAGSIEGFVYVAMNAFHHSAQTFISQNIGAGQYSRVKEILRTCILCTIVTGSVLIIGILSLDEPLLRIYNKDPAVVAAGAERLLIGITLYVVFGIADVLTGAMRGCDSPVVPVVVNLLCTCAFRLVWITVLDTSVVSVRWVYASYPISWVMLLTSLLVCWRHLYQKKIAPNIKQGGETDG